MVLPRKGPALGPYHDLREMLLGIVLAMLAGSIGAAAWTHTAGWYVTFMTGNSERMVLEHFHGRHLLGVSALASILLFVFGAFVATLGRLYVWRKSSHGATMLTTGAVYAAWIMDQLTDDAGERFGFVPVLALAFGLGALNTSISRGNQVAMPLSYVTGTLVKLGQGLALHASKMQRWVWVAQAATYAGFVSGVAIGGALFDLFSTEETLAVLAILSTVTTAVTWKLDHSKFSAKCVSGA